MAGTGPQHPSPPDPGGEAVRVIDKPAASRRAVVLYLAFAVAVVAAGLAWLLHTPPRPGEPRSAGSQAAAPVEGRRTAEPGDAAVDTVRRPVRVAPARAHNDEEHHEVAGSDPDDIASYFRPGDPEPTAAELIEALNHAGIRSGIGAFNPPGTSPPLEGLVVPEDYELPEGFVRHYQVTDEGEPLEAILLFSPDFEFFDADGRPIEIPENRVVPPELAPPGLPIPPPQPPSP